MKHKRFNKHKEIGDIDLLFDLISSFSNLNNAKKATEFLSDLLTATEIRNISVRLRIAKLILSGKSQREIVLATNSSFGTVNKVNVWLNEGGNGFRNAVSKLPIRWVKPNKLPKGPIEYHLPELLIATGQYLVASNQEKNPAALIENIKRKKEVDKEFREQNKQLYSR